MLSESLLPLRYRMSSCQISLRISLGVSVVNAVCVVEWFASSQPIYCILTALDVSFGASIKKVALAPLLSSLKSSPVCKLQRPSPSNVSAIIGLLGISNLLRNQFSVFGKFTFLCAESAVFP